MDLKRQCIENKVNFYFKQTGYKFKKDGKIFTIPRKYQIEQARKSGLNEKKDFNFLVKVFFIEK